VLDFAQALADAAELASPASRAPHIASERSPEIALDGAFATTEVNTSIGERDCGRARLDDFLGDG
jgi:hypothetical protein